MAERGTPSGSPSAVVSGLAALKRMASDGASGVDDGSGSEPDSVVARRDPEHGGKRRRTQSGAGTAREAGAGDLGASGLAQRELAFETPEVGALSPDAVPPLVEAREVAAMLDEEDPHAPPTRWVLLLDFPEVLNMAQKLASVLGKDKNELLRLINTYPHYKAARQAANAPGGGGGAGPSSAWVYRSPHSAHQADLLNDGPFAGLMIETCGGAGGRMSIIALLRLSFPSSAVYIAALESDAPTAKVCRAPQRFRGQGFVGRAPQVTCWCLALRRAGPCGACAAPRGCQHICVTGAAGPDCLQRHCWQLHLAVPEGR